MYYVKEDEPLKQKYCITEGPPYYRWETAEIGINNIPEVDSSTL